MPSNTPDPSSQTVDLDDGLSRAEMLAGLRAEQIKRWQRGDRVRVEAYLAQPQVARLLEGPDGPDADAVLDLVYNEVVMRDELGESPGVDEYVGRFPQFESRLRRQFQVHDLMQ